MTNTTFVSDQVFKHNQIQDCWLIIQGKIYDVTPFMEDHPGGSEVLLASTGKDATADFEDIGHSDDAKAMMDKYYIGDLHKTAPPLEHTHAPPAPAPALALAPHHKPYKTSQFVLKILLPLFIFTLAFAYAKN